MENSPQPDLLPEMLPHWRVQPARNPQFRAAVWRRIARDSRDSWGSYVRAHRLAWTVAALAVAGVAGWTGHVTARARAAADRDAMVTTYLVELDPRVQALQRP